MLMLMYIKRGVVPPTAFNPTYTFGAPAIFCEGGSGCGPCASSCLVWPPSPVPLPAISEVQVCVSVR
jgi:hypothetical protein